MMNNIEQHVTSLDLSRRLAGLGVKAKSIYKWQKGYGGRDGERIWSVKEISNGIPAYLASELAGMLPVIHKEPKGCKFDYYPIVIPHKDGGRWCGYYQAIGVEMYLFDELYADTMAECYGLLLAHLLETGAVGLQDN